MATTIILLRRAKSTMNLIISLRANHPKTELSPRLSPNPLIFQVFPAYLLANL